MVLHSHRAAIGRRVAGLVVAVVAVGLVMGPVARGAESPEAAVQALVGRVNSGDLEGLGADVCPERLDAIRDQFDPAAAMGAPTGAVRIQVSDASTSLVDQTGDSAVVRLTATMRIEMDEGQARDLVIAELEASGMEPTEENIEQWLGFVRSFANEDIPVDEEIDVVSRDGQWLVCDDLDDDASTEPGTVPGTFTGSGMCGLVTVEELDAITPLSFGSSAGDAEFCQWIAADDTEYLSLDVGLLRGQSLEDYRTLDPETVELTVADRPALVSYGQLYVEVDEGLLTVVPYLIDSQSAAGLDPVAYATRVAELFLPRLGQLPAGDAAVEPEPAGPAMSAGPLDDCGVISLDALNALGPLRYDTVSGEGGSCLFSTTNVEEGYYVLSVTLDPASDVEDLRRLFGEGVDTDVDGRPAFGAMDTLWVQLEDGMLAVSPLLTGVPAAEGLDPYAYAADVARVVIDAMGAAG